jgi:hypothetical protein
MTWLWVLLGTWLAVAVVTALVIGRMVHKADVIEHTESAPDTPSPQADQAPAEEHEEPPAAGMGFVIPPARRTLAEQ